MVGDLLDESGWATLLTESGIATPGRADSYIHASHLKRKRRANQVTAFAIVQLKSAAYDQLKEDGEDMGTWKTRMEKSSPTIHFWQMIQELEFLGLDFARSHRERNYEHYVQCLHSTDLCCH